MWVEMHVKEEASGAMYCSSHVNVAQLIVK